MPVAAVAPQVLRDPLRLRAVDQFRAHIGFDRHDAVVERLPNFAHPSTTVCRASSRAAAH